MMSYCHFRGCGDNLVQFSTRAINERLGPGILAHVPGCVEFLGDPELVFEDGFESGDLMSWSGSG